VEVAHCFLSLADLLGQYEDLGSARSSFRTTIAPCRLVPVTTAWESTPHYFLKWTHCSRHRLPSWAPHQVLKSASDAPVSWGESVPTKLQPQQKAASVSSYDGCMNFGSYCRRRWRM